MKIISNIFSVILLLVLFSGCGKDNFDAPESKLVGRVTYQGQALNLRGTGEAVQLQLYQDGYEKNDPISVFVGEHADRPNTIHIPTPAHCISCFFIVENL